MDISLECTEIRGCGQFFNKKYCLHNFTVLPKKNATAVMYIHDNNSWEMLYVLLKIIFLCLILICLSDSNHAVMEKVY